MTMMGGPFQHRLGVWALKGHPLRVTVESSALAEGRFHKLAESAFFEGSRSAAIGALVLFWFDSQEREFVSGTKEEILKFMRFYGDGNSNFFDLLVEHEYIKKISESDIPIGLSFYEIAGNAKHVAKLQSLRQNGSLGGKQSVKTRTSKQLLKVVEAPASTLQCSTVQFNTLQCNTKDNRSFDSDFEGIYKMYPRKVGKSKGLKICEREIKSEQDLKLLITAINHYKSEIAQNKTEPKFIKHFSTFMACWRDYLEKEAVPIVKRPQYFDSTEIADPRKGPLSAEVKQMLDTALGRKGD